MKGIFLVCVLIALLSVIQAQERTPIAYTQLGTPLKHIDASGIQPHTWVYYTLASKEGDTPLPVQDGQKLYFMVTPLAGDVDLYVTTNGQNPAVNDQGHCSNCIKESLSAHGDFVWIEKSQFPQGDFTFVIGIYSQDVRATFTFTTWITEAENKQGTIMTIEDGLPQVAISLAHTYTYFKFKVSDSPEIDNVPNPNDFEVTATSVFGDPDICVSIEGEGQERCIMNDAKTFWSSQRYGSDVVLVDHTSSHFDATKYFFVGVKAFSKDTLYTLSITSNKKYTRVLESQTVDAFVRKNEFRYFTFYNPDNTAAESLLFNVQLAAYGGDPDMYIQKQSEVTAGNPPSPTNCRWCAAEWGQDNIEIKNADQGAYMIAVKGYKNTRFHFMGTTERNNILLKDGVPVTYVAQPANKKYFKFLHLDAASGLSLQAVSETNNQLEMYLSDSNSHPDASKNDHIGQQSGAAVTYSYPIGQTTAGTKYMSIVAPEGGNVTVLASSTQNAVPLQDSKTIYYNRMDRGIYRYFVFEIQDAFTEGTVSFSVSTYRGEVDLYVSTDEHRPTKEKCASEGAKCWKSETQGVDSITIDAAELAEGTIPKFWIGVIGNYQHNTFSIVAHVGNTEIAMVDGLEVPGSVMVKHYKYYKFYIENRESVSITLTVADSHNTDVDLYGSRHRNPDSRYCSQRGNCDKSTKRGSDVIYLQEATPGWYYVGVYGYRANGENNPISFSIVARARYHVVHANDWAMIYESTPAGKIQQIHVPNVYPLDKYIIVSATLISGRTKMYLSANDTGALPPYQYMFSDGSWPGNVIMVKNTEETAQLFQSQEWSIGVEALEASDYFVSVTSGNNPIFDYADLALNVPRLSIAPNDDAILFNYNIPTNWDDPSKVFDDYYLSIRVLSGQIRLYADQNYPMDVHNPNNTFIYAGGNGVFKLEKEKLKPGFLFISVMGLQDDATFEMTLSRANDAKYLIQDQPQQFATQSEDYSYFEVLNSQSNPLPMTVTIDSCDMNPAPTFYASVQEQRPTEKVHDVTSKSVSKFTQKMDANAEGATQYYIGVHGIKGPGSLYSVFASSHQDTKPVVSSKTLTGIVSKKLKTANVITLSIPRAEPPKRFADKPLTYHVYQKQIRVVDGNPEMVNMKTVCGIKDNGDLIGSALEGGAGGSFKFDVENDRKQVYQIAVVVQDSLGLSTAYDDIWIVHGKVYPNYPTFLQALAISVGTILIMIFGLIVAFLFLIVAFYFGIGTIINIIRGKKGFDVIPNKNFWVNLPGLILNGAIGLVNCFRRKTSYNNFEKADDEIDGDDGYGVDGDAPVDGDNNEASRDDYGAL